MSFGQTGGYSSRAGFGRSFGSFKKPVEVGQEYSVTIADTSRRGDGIAKVDGFVIFVPATKLGQDIKVKVTHVSDRYATAEVVEGPATAASEYSDNVSQR